MFQLAQVRFSYPSEGATKYALDQVSLSIPSGEVTAILGLSGSGKTTLLNLLGLLCGSEQHSGSVDYSRGSDDRRSDAELRRDDFGFVLQSAYMLPHFTCGDNVGMPLRLQGVSLEQIDARVSAILQLADPTGKLAQLKDRRAGDVSGGERQRMAVLRAVVHDPRVLFADEPCSSLDPLNAELIRDLIRRWKRGELLQSNRTDRTLLLVTHDIQSAWDEAENFVVLRNGQTTQPSLLTKSQLTGPSDLRARMMPDETAMPAGPQAVSQPLLADDHRDDQATVSSRFYTWFAHQNLWERTARRSTWTNICGLAVVAGFILLTFGLVLGVRQARKDQLSNDPLNLCLWIGSNVVKTRIDHEFISTLENEIRNVIPSEMLLGIHPFSEIHLQIYSTNENSWRVMGRTLAADDPMLQSIKWDAQSGSPLTSIGDGHDGVIVSRDFLNTLGYEPSQSPEFIRVEPPGGESCQVPILAIAPGGLPLGHEFVIGDQYFQRLQSEHQDTATDHVFIRPIPPDWPEPSLLPAPISALFGSHSGTEGFPLLSPLEQVDADGHRSWLLQHNHSGDVPFLSEWRIYIGRINKLIKAEGHTDSPELANLSDTEGDDVDVLPVAPSNYDYAGIYFRDIEALESANGVCEKYGLSASKDLVAKLVAIGGQTKAILTLILILGGLFGLVILSFMALLQVERNEKKTGQFGMLKAIGMPRASLARLALTESMMIWVWGTLLGLTTAAMIGPVAARVLNHYGMPAKFIYWWPLFLVAPLGSFAVCILSNFVATSKSRNAPASESLRAG